MESLGRLGQKRMSNVGSYYFKHESEEETDTHESEPEGTSVQLEKQQRVEPISNMLENSDKPYKKVLNYSQEDIHALASKAELLVLKTSAHNDDSDYSGEEDDIESYCSEISEHKAEYPESPQLQAPDIEHDAPETGEEKVCDANQVSSGMQQQEENSLHLSGTWDHDLQEQYLSEGSTLGSWDNSMKSVLCFGEDYSNYIRRKSELPSLENITISVCGLEGSPRNQPHDAVDPIILLRMSERDWISAIHELKEKKETNFGEKENFERMITTCNVNLEILRSLVITEESNRPKCLPRDHKDLVDTWELLLSDLNKKLGQCITYNKINQDIEQFSSKLDTMAEDREELNRDEETDVFKQMETSQRILSQLEVMKPSMLDTSTSVYHLLSSVSSTLPEDVQKISLVCFCKQELILLSEKWDESHSEATTSLAMCEDQLRERQGMERELADLKLRVGRERWPVRTFSRQSVSSALDKDRIGDLKQQLKKMHESGAVSKSYFIQTLKYLEFADKQLVVPQDALPCVKTRGDTYLPLLVVTSVIVFYSYYYPVNWWEKACKLYHLMAG
jgi:hypothetical protein